MFIKFQKYYHSSCGNYKAAGTCNKKTTRQPAICPIWPVESANPRLAEQNARWGRNDKPVPFRIIATVQQCVT